MHTRCLTLVALALVTLALALALPALAQSGDYAIDWYSVDGGGGTSSGGSFTLSGAIGQPEAGVMAGGAFTLTGGFWSDLAAGNVKVYLPLIQR
jgi:hypothetical protein